MVVGGSAGGRPTEPLLSGLTAHPELGADGSPAAAGGPGGQHGLAQQIPDDVLGLESLATHHVSLEDAPEMYKIFQEKKDGCIKVVLKP